MNWSEAGLTANTENYEVFYRKSCAENDQRHQDFVNEFRALWQINGGRA
jgi:hypothetical protein